MDRKNRSKKKLKDEETMARKSRPEKREDRRLSVKERHRNESDVKFWVSQTQPSRPQEAVPAPAKEVYNPSSSAESVQSEELLEEPVRLDGGYAWVIVGFSFFLHFIADGLTFSFGSLFADIVHKFEVNRFVAGFIGSLFLAGPLAFSPFAGIIGDNFGSRTQLAAGLSIASFGIVLAGLGLYFVEVWLFGFGFSLFLMIGLALIYNGAIVMINLYFNDRKSGLATSFAVSGTGVGTITFPLLHILYDDLSPDNAALYMILTALGLCLTALIICIFFIKDVEWTSDDIDYKRRLFEKNLRRLNREVDDNDFELEDNPKTLRRCQSLPNANNITDIRGSIIDLGTSVQNIRETVSMTKQIEPPPPRSRSVGTFMKRNLAVIPEYTMLNADDFNHLDHLDLHLGHSPCNTVHATRRRMLSKNSMSLDFLQDQDEISDAKRFFSDSEDEEESDVGSDSALSNDGESSESDLSDKVLEKKEKAPLDASDIAKKEAAKLLLRPSVAMNQAPGRVLVSRTAYRVVTNTNMLVHQGKMASAPHVCPRKKNWRDDPSVIPKTLSALGEAAKQFPIYKKAFASDRALRFFAFSVTLLYLVLDVPYVSFYDHAVETLKLSKAQGSVLTSVIGAFSLVSTLAIGVCSHNRRFKGIIFSFNGCSMFFLGVATFFAAIVVQFKWICVICAVLGTFLSSNYVLQSVMLTHLYQDNVKFSKTYAMVSMMQGIATGIGPPSIGFIRDFTGEYTIVYYFSAVVLFISGLCSIYAGHLDEIGDRGNSFYNGSPASNRSPSKASKNGDVPLLEAIV